MKTRFQLEIDTDKKIIRLGQAIGNGQVATTTVDYGTKKLKHGLRFAADLMAQVTRFELAQENQPKN